MADAPTNAAPNTAEAPQLEMGFEPGFLKEAEEERTQGRMKALKALKEGVGDGDVSFDEDDGIEPSGEHEKPKEEPKKEAKPPEGEDRIAQAREKLNAALEGLSDDQIADLLGAKSDAFAALSGKRATLKRKEAALEADRAAFNAESAEFKSAKADFDELLIEAASNPRKAMELFNWTIEDAIHFEATDGDEPLERRLKRLEGSLDERVESKLKTLDEREQALKQREAQLAVSAYENAIKADISKADREEFPLVFRYDDAEVFDTVRKVQYQAWVDSGKTKTVAVPQVLRYLQAQLQAQLDKLSGGRQPPPSREGPPKGGNLAAGDRPRHLTDLDASERTDDDDGPEYGSPEWREGAVGLLNGRRRG